jgi:heat shock protein HtpX
MDGLFTTHPATENRIAALKRQAAEMGRTANPGGFGEPRRQPWGTPTTRRPGPWR